MQVLDSVTFEFEARPASPNTLNHHLNLTPRSPTERLSMSPKGPLRLDVDWMGHEGEDRQIKMKIVIEIKKVRVRVRTPHSALLQPVRGRIGRWR